MGSSKKRWLRVLPAALLVGAGAVALEASPAMAACGSQTNPVCIGNDPQGYDATLIMQNGTYINVNFRLECNNGRWFGDNGAFTARAGNTYSYTFAVGSQGTCHVQLRQGGTILRRSPDLTR